MATLAAQLNSVVEKFKTDAPEPVKQAIGKANADFQASFDRSAAIQVGAKLPPFTLLNAVGEDVSSASLLAKGPLLISFYRGGWCPFCNLELAALQKHAADFAAKGVTLVAVSPELPNTSLSTAEKHALTFPVLSDVGNVFARKLGIVWKQPHELRGVFKSFGTDLVVRNGDDSFEVPVPATLLVDKDGVVRNTFVEPDYMERLEPLVALEWIDKL